MGQLNGQINGSDDWVSVIWTPWEVTRQSVSAMVSVTPPEMVSVIGVAKSGQCGRLINSMSVCQVGVARRAARLAAGRCRGDFVVGFHNSWSFLIIIPVVLSVMSSRCLLPSDDAWNGCESIAIRSPGAAVSTAALGARDTSLFAFAVAHASHSVVIGPFILTPVVDPTKWLSASGPGCPSLRCHCSASAFNDVRSAWGVLLFWCLVIKAAWDSSSGRYSRTYWS